MAQRGSALLTGSLQCRHIACRGHQRLTIFALLMCFASFAGDIKHINITYDYISDNPNETPEQAEQMAIQMAKQKALEEHFGLDVVGVLFVIHKTFFHPDYTVGHGIAPCHTLRLAGLCKNCTYSRWGSTPRPEDKVILLQFVYMVNPFEMTVWRLRICYFFLLY